ncbi:MULTISPECIES: nuclear transport factor 2 family protein [Streptomyces violaceusniger group]|uniref:SnoaL-like domain-containing protein n=2 Tax=Streptomyces rhizosphaericus TaxID=114699 RepID=A0ABN1R9Z6_9ACTN|nr:MULTISPECIES: nuclear transport factor 2 family protein [Streptomyces violaceusniger group]
MSNADVVRAYYAALATGDFEAARTLTDPEIDFNIAPGFPAGGRYHGHVDLFEGFYPASFEAWSHIEVEVDEFLEFGDTVISLGRYVGTTRASNTEFSSPFAHVNRVRDGRLAAVHQYVDTLVLDRAIEGRPLALDENRRWVTRVTEPSAS